MAARTVLVDTNVLLTASSPTREHHALAIGALTRWPPSKARLCTCGQVLREYLVVATRPLDANGLGLSCEAALENAEVFAERLRFLPEDERVTVRLRQLVRELSCSGKIIHDANLVATASVARVDAVLTANPRDFQRFWKWIQVIDLKKVEEG